MYRRKRARMYFSSYTVLVGASIVVKKTKQKPIHLKYLKIALALFNVVDSI